jgi:Flp pilus assembly protein TadD
MMQGHLNDAIPLFRDALRFDPRSADAHYNLGVALEKQGQLAVAADHFRRALQLKGDWPAALADLAWLLAATRDERVRNATEAIQLAERLAMLTERRDASALDALAAAYAAAGQFDRAVATVEEALNLTPSGPSAAGMVGRRELYRQGQPYRERAGGAQAPDR